MSKVYVLIERYGHDAEGDVIGVYSRLDTAKKSAESHAGRRLPWAMERRGEHETLHETFRNGGYKITLFGVR